MVTPWTVLFGAVNAVGRVVGGLPLPVLDLDPVRLLEEAREDTGLASYGGEGIPEGDFRQGLARFLHAADREAALTFLGRIATREDVLRLLSNRLRLVDERRRRPEVGGEEIREPVFIVGFPRTGTTLLHGLLGSNPAVRVPRTWEVMYPSLPPGAESASEPGGGASAAGEPGGPGSGSRDPDPRIRTVRKQLRWFDRMNPEYKVAHPVGAELPQECMEIQSPTFQSERFWRTHHVPSYVEWLDARSTVEAYRFHRATLQHLQHREPGGRWVLKNPPHTFSMVELHETYPDARFIQTHRDPVTVMSSFVSHTRTLRASFTDRPERLDADTVVERWGRGMDRLLDFRDAGAVPEERWVDVRYRDLLADPIGTVGRIHDAFGLDLSAEAERRMRAFLVEHPQHEHGVHRYSPESTGVDPERTRARFARYRDRFGFGTADPLESG